MLTSNSHLISFLLSLLSREFWRQVQSVRNWSVYTSDLPVVIKLNSYRGYNEWAEQSCLGSHTATTYGWWTVGHREEDRHEARLIIAWVNTLCRVMYKTTRAIVREIQRWTYHKDIGVQLSLEYQNIKIELLQLHHLQRNVSLKFLKVLIPCNSYDALRF